MKEFVFMTFMALSVTFSSQSFACGGDDLTDEEVRTTGQVVKAIAVASAGQKQNFEIEKIVRAGNQLLGLDEKGTVRAMCAANFIHVYLKGDQGTRCLTVLDVRANKQTHKNFASVSCQPKGGEIVHADLK